MKGNAKWLIVGAASVTAALGALEAVGVLPVGVGAALRTLLAALVGLPAAPGP